MPAATTTTPNPDRFEVEEFDTRLERAREESMPVDTDRYVDGVRVVWAPQEGSQVDVLQCPMFEVLYHGTRGPGKTDALLMSFAQHVDKGYGASWRGIIFRRTYPELADVVAKSEKWFRQIFPEAKFNRAPRMAWEWPTGESLLFRHMLRPADYFCVDEGEVLTRRGWIPIQDVEVGEMALTCDPATKKTEWLPVAEKTDIEYDGDIVRHEGRGRYMSFTPRHKLVTADGELVAYEDLPRDASILRSGWTCEDREGISGFDVPFVAPMHGGGTPDLNPRAIAGDDYCELMGWWLAEGWASEGGKKNIIGIAQSKPKTRKTIRNLLDRIGIRYTETPVSFIWRSKSWAEYLRQFGKAFDKFVPREILDCASENQLRIFFDAFIAGDGSCQGDRKYAFTGAPGLRDGIMSVGVLLGYAPHCIERDRKGRKRVTYQIAFNPRRVLRLYTDNRVRNRKPLSKKTQVSRVRHKGRVYCIGFRRNHTFFLRQRGSVWLSGNSYHGHEYPFIGWEELTNWATDECYRRMLSCCRSSTPGVPRHIRSNTNPFGVGSNWIKERWRLHGGRWRDTIIIDDAVDANGDPEPTRVAIHGHIDENKILLEADPNYKQTIAAAATNEAMLDAWLNGSWDITAGGMFDDVWSRDRNDVGDFDVPESWSIDRAFDWGSSKPFSVGWYARSDGTDLVFRDGSRMTTVPGDVFRFREWYGWTGRPNEGKRMLAVDIARGIVEREIEWGLRDGWNSRVSPGPADSAIFATENGVCIAEDMERSMSINGETYPGVSWLPADKGPGSRRNGWERMRQLIRNASPKNEGEPREEPGFFVVGDRCPQFLRTVLTLPRSEKDMDDVDTDAEDHIGDEVRYRLSGGERSEVSVTEI